PKSIYKDPDDGRQRFLLELEFVQCLANPTYFHYLAQNRYFEDEAFIGYLKYPHCLFFLELLQNANFRAAMAHPGNKELAHRQQFYFWKNYRNTRLKHILRRSRPEPVAAPQASVPPPASLPPTVNNVTGASVAVHVPPASQVLSPMQLACPLALFLQRMSPRAVGVIKESGRKMLDSTC
ncbi:hypothetical protein RJ639_034224, partial [Escallonia herrerae]